MKVINVMPVVPATVMETNVLWLVSQTSVI